MNYKNNTLFNIVEKTNINILLGKNCFGKYNH